MKSGHGFTLDGPFEPAHADLGLASRHVAGLSDEIGDRVLILDDRGTPSLELLRFRRMLTATPGFEVALRRRVERMRQFAHPAFASAPAVEYLSEDRGLVLLSSYTPERRLSEVLEEAKGPAFASSLIQQLAPALAALHHYGDGIGHGALTANRIVISPEGQLIIVEHVLGSALERLQLTAARMHHDLGLPVPATEVTARPRIDSRTDYFQLGMIALSLLLGRPVSADEYPENLDNLLDQVLPASDRESAEQFRGLRAWLERALQINGRLFLASGEATAALRDISEEGADQIARRWRELLGISHAHADDRVELHQALIEESPSSEDLEEDLEAPYPEILPVEPSPVSEATTVSSVEVPLEDPAPPVTPELSEEFRPTALSAIAQPQAVLPPSPRRNPSSSRRTPRAFFVKPQGYLQWAVVALALCVIGEAVAIGILLWRQRSAVPPVRVAEVHLETPDPGASVVVDGRSAGLTPLRLAIGPDVRSISVVSPRPAPRQELIVGSTGQQNSTLESGPDAGVKAGARPGNAPAAVPAAQRVGGIRLSSPIDLEVFEGDTRLGSSATGIVSAPAGRHELDLVNSVLGFRARQLVDIKGGQVVSLTVSPPSGRININAVPWAEVLIDGKAVGETPIGNLSISLGQHEIIFRHPQLGEQRRTVVVRSDAISRVSANLER